MNTYIVLKLSEYIEKYDSFDMRSWIQISSDLMADAIDQKKIIAIDCEKEEYKLFSDNYITVEELEEFCDDVSDLEDYENSTFCGVSSFNIFQELGVEHKNECLTTACVAGWAVLMKNNFEFGAKISSNHTDISEIASDYLGITDGEAHNLYGCQKGSVWWLVADEYEQTSYEKFIRQELSKASYRTTEDWREKLQKNIEEILSSEYNIMQSKEFYSHEYTSFLYANVDAKMASDVLRRLATTDDILLGSDGDDESYFVYARFSESYINNKNKEKENA